MYESFYGLDQHPFSLTPDSDFLFLNENFQKCLDQLTYAVNRREAFSVLIGDVGTGKTTICWALLLRMSQKVRTALILNPLLSIDDLLRAIIQDFKIKPSYRQLPWRPRSAPEVSGLADPSWMDGLTRKQLIDELNRFLLEGAKDDVRSLLIIDEAQNLSPECLEQLRVLSNLETSKRKLLQIIFSGQLELDLNLNLPQLRQLKQRITVRCSLKPLSKSDMVKYIHHRLWKAGSNRSLSFSRKAFGRIYKNSGGYPRLINVICDRALMAGYKKRSWTITDKMAKEALEHLAARKAKKVYRFFPTYLKHASIAFAALMILAGIAYFVWTWSSDIGNLISRAMIQPPSEVADTTASETAPKTATELQDDANTQSQVSIPPAVTPLPTSGFSLQVHSLHTQQDATRAVAEFKQKGFPSYQRLITNRDGTRWHVVFLGPFENIETAWDMADTILEREQWRTILRTHSP